MEKLIITAALTGNVTLPTQTHYLPHHATADCRGCEKVCRCRRSLSTRPWERPEDQQTDH